jgi:hypothetical protein
MKIKAQDLKVGQTFHSVTGINPVHYTAHEVKHHTNYDGSVTVIVIVDPDNPFISSSFCSYNPNTIVEVI